MSHEIEPVQALFETKDGHKAHGGSGRVTNHTCGLCGDVRNIPPTEEDAANVDWIGPEWTYELSINGVLVLDCCFDKIELVFLYLATLPNAMPWLQERLEDRVSAAKEVVLSEEERAVAAEALAALLGGQSGKH